MPTYVTLYRFTQQGIANIKDSPKRMAAAKKAVQKAGGKMKAIYVTMGHYDVVAISEWKSEEAAAAQALALASMGNVSTETLRAFTEAEFKKILDSIA